MNNTLLLNQTVTAGGVEVWSITGNIVDGAAAAIEGVTVTLTGDASDSTTTDASGDYAFTGLVDGSYTVTPTKTGNTFAPTSDNVTISGASDTSDFAGSALYVYNLDWNDETVGQASSFGAIVGTSATVQNWYTADGYAPAGLTKCLRVVGAANQDSGFNYILPVAPPTARALNIEALMAIQNVSGDYQRGYPATGLKDNTSPTAQNDAIQCYLATYAQNMYAGVRDDGVNEAVSTDGTVVGRDEFLKWMKIRMTFYPAADNPNFVCNVIRASNSVAICPEVSQQNSKLSSVVVDRINVQHYADYNGGTGWLYIGRLYIGDATLGWPSDT